MPAPSRVAGVFANWSGHGLGHSAIGTKCKCRGAQPFPELGVDRLHLQPAGDSRPRPYADLPQSQRWPNIRPGNRSNTQK